MKNKKGFTLIELMVVVVIIGFLVIPSWILFTWWTGRSLDWVLTAWKYHPVHVAYWLDFLLTIVGNGVTFCFDLIIEIIRRVQ